MFWKRITLFRLLGFAIRVDASWIIIALLVTWSLAAGYFPYQYEGLAEKTYWVMAGLGALGLFISIILHEFSHSIVARKYDIPISGITLFVFGGVAEMEKEPDYPKAEFMMAIAGPIASMGLAVIFWWLGVFAGASGWPIPVEGVLKYLGLINGILAVFNMVPAFPLDGGRILRSILWHKMGDLRKATQIASKYGARFGLAFMIAGGFFFLTGNLIGGIWWVLIGIFIRNASSMSYRQVVLRKTLEGEVVSRFMKADPVTVPSTLPIRNLIEEYFYRHHHTLFPVTKCGRLFGIVDLNDVKKVKPADWDRVTVEKIARPVTEENSVSP
ncbi:MAG: site-2 protease family protein, partial [Sphingomonadales bacterium]